MKETHERVNELKKLFAFGICFLAILLLATTPTSAKPKTQTARVVIGEKGFTPGSLKLRRGVRTRLTFLRTTDATCAKEIVLPDFNIRSALPLNQPVDITCTPKKRGPLTFACGMNMMRGQLIVQ